MASKLVSSFQRIKISKYNDSHHEHLFSTAAAITKQSIENPGLELPLDCNVRLSFLPSSCKDIRSLKQAHAHIIISGLEQDVFTGTKLVNGYTKYGSIAYARQVFDKMPARDLVSWTAMISGYAQNGHPAEALSLFHQMQVAGIMPDIVTLVSALSACANLGVLSQGKRIHAYIMRCGFELGVFVGTSLIGLYAKCGSLEVARQLFDKMPERNIVSWNAMIAGYAGSEHPKEGLQIFYQMQLAGFKPNSITMLGMLEVCSRLQTPKLGKSIHRYIIREGYESDIAIGTVLIDTYAKCGCLDIARQVFDKMYKRNVVSWSAMIAGYVQNGCANEALVLFDQMQLNGVKPNSVTMLSVLSACTQLGALHKGKCIHDQINRDGFESDVSVQNCLIDMYAKCGSIEAAKRIFDKMTERNVVSWSVMIMGCGMHGLCDDALALFSEMLNAGMKPNHVTFLGVLSACSHSGLIDTGWQYFHRMSQDYCITPRLEHYACMVDLLGRAGHLYEAYEFINKMPVEPDAGIWGALLGACRIHCNVELGEHAAQCLFDLNSENSGYYVLLSNIYAAADRWDGVAKVRSMIKDRGLKKTPGWSSVEIDSRVHVFLVDD